MIENMQISAQVDTSYYGLVVQEFKRKFRTSTIRLQKFPSVWIPHEEINNFIDALEAENELAKERGSAIPYVTHQGNYELISVGRDALIYFESNASGLHDCEIHYTHKGVLEKIKNIINLFEHNGKKLKINWYTDNKGNCEEIIDISNNITMDCIYPFVGNVDNYIRKFLQSDASIIILIGEPGTGKTNFIRNMLYYMEDKEIYLSFDESVLKSDRVFVDFVSNQSAGAFVIEDADMMIKSRKIGDEMMSKFLNIGDGLVKLNGKKLIFSTNLESVNDIDPAIMRPGRCFDVLKFRKLTLKEANVVCGEYELPFLSKTKDYTLAEIFNQETATVERKFGFA